MGWGRIIDIIGPIDRLLLSHAATGLEWVFAFKLTTEALTEWGLRDCQKNLKI
jgi:hypothetical protein